MRPFKNQTIEVHISDEILISGVQYFEITESLKFRSKRKFCNQMRCNLTGRSDIRLLAFNSWPPDFDLATLGLCFHIVHNVARGRGFEMQKRA